MNSPAITRQPRAACEGSPACAGFSLVEVVLALGVVAFALIAVMSLIPVGLGALKDSMASTTNSLLLSNVRSTLVGQSCVVGDLGPYFYDADAKYLGTTLGPESFYKVQVKLAQPYLAVTNSNLLVATVKITWPANNSGNSTGNNLFQTSYLVSPLTGPEWPVLDPTYKPKIDL